MQFSKEVKPFVSELLRKRVDKTLTHPNDVVNIAARFQPAHGFSNDDWTNVCSFILMLKDIEGKDAAARLAEKFNLETNY